MKLTISIIDTDAHFDIYDKDILELELALNQSIYKHEWIHIGDHLYNFYMKEKMEYCVNKNIFDNYLIPYKIKYLKIKKYQINFLKLLLY